MPTLQDIISQVTGQGPSTPGVGWFSNRIRALQKDNTDRDEMFKMIDDYEKQNWKLPDKFDQQWIIKATEPRFAQVLNAGKNILGSKPIQLTVDPYRPNDEASRDIADRHEAALKWLFTQASRRREATIEEDLAHSALKYAEIAPQVVFLPEQIKAMDAVGAPTQRLKAMRRQGLFVVNIHDPRDVYARYSAWGLEEVALIQQISLDEIYETWGDAAVDLETEVALQNSQRKDKITNVTLYDYWSWKWRAVFVSIGEGQAGKQLIPLLIDKWTMPFSPWACRISGTSLELSSGDKRRPLLYDAVKGNLGELMNRVRTLRFSDYLRYSGSPKRWFQSGRRSQPDVDKWSPDNAVHIYEDESTGSFDPPIPDPGMDRLYAEVSQDHERSTLSSVLLGGEIPSQTAFASINLVTHSAMGAVNPFRFVMENAAAGIAEAMMLYIHYTQTDVVGYGINEEDETRVEHAINWKEIDPDNLYVSAKVEADLPTDDQTKAAIIGMLLDRGALSRRDAMEYWGIENVSGAEDRIMLEKMMDTYLLTEIENIRMTQSQAAREKIRQEIMQTEVMPQMQALLAEVQGRQAGQAQGAAGPRPGPAVSGPPGRGNPPANPRESGIPSDADPNQGGPVPSGFNPGATREGMTGRDRAGNPVP